MPNRFRLAVMTTLAALLLGAVSVPAMASQASCDPSYPSVCIPPPPPDLDCADVKQRNFKVEAPDPHHFDADHDGIGCEDRSGGGTGSGGAEAGAGRAAGVGARSTTGGASTGGGSAGVLPFTGSNTAPLLVSGLLLVSVGGLLAWRLRSRPQQ